MNKSNSTHVAVAVVTDESERVLVTWNDVWGAFTLPMTKVRAAGRGSELPLEAAVRAAAEVLGVPARPAVPPLVGDLTDYRISARDGSPRQYQFHLARIEPHPHFLNQCLFRQPHFWASPYALLSTAGYRPLSPTVPVIVKHIIKAFRIPERMQPATTLVISRTGETGREFLLRWNERWQMYTFPASTRDPSGGGAAPADLVAAVAAKDLGPDAATRLAWTVEKDEVRLQGMQSGSRDSLLRGVPTTYVHLVGRAEPAHGVEFQSSAPLHWATGDEVHQGQTAGIRPAGGPVGEPGPVSPTVKGIAERLGLLDDYVAEDEIIAYMQRAFPDQQAG